MLAAALVTGILWAKDKSRGEKCTGIEVQVINADSTSFVTPQGVLNDLKGQGIKLVGKRMGDINASEIEEALRVSPYLENADIVKCQDGKVLIRVSQLVPVFRVFDGGSSYYVNRAGKHMSATNYYHSDVPVVQGHFTRKFPPTVTMYIVRDTNNIILVPSISGHVVNIGNVSGLENKFAKLKLFYREVMPQRGWNTFDTISVKWNHQVVATRRAKAVQQVIVDAPDDDEQAPDIQTMTIGTAADVKREQQEKTAKTDADVKKEDEKNQKKSN